MCSELAEVGYAGLDDNTRRQTAIDLLKEAGYTWETEPTIEGEGEEATFTAGAAAFDELLGLVQMMGGRIWVESAIGAGTTVSFALPKVWPEEGRGESAGG